MIIFCSDKKQHWAVREMFSPGREGGGGGGLFETIVDYEELCNLRTDGRCISLLSLWLKVKTRGTSST